MKILGYVLPEKGAAICVGCVNDGRYVSREIVELYPITELDENDSDITCDNSICGHSLIKAANIDSSEPTILGCITKDSKRPLCPACMNLLLTAYSAVHYTDAIMSNCSNENPIICYHCNETIKA